MQAATGLCEVASDRLGPTPLGKSALRDLLVAYSRAL